MSLVDQLPPSIEWRVYSGDTARITILVRDSRDKPIELEEYEVIGQLKATPSSTPSTEDLVVDILEGGVIVVSITDTAEIDELSYFDIQASKDGVVDTILRGTIIREQDVTN